MVRSRGLEPPRARPTAPSTLRVYLFRHDRKAGSTCASAAHVANGSWPYKGAADLRVAANPGWPQMLNRLHDEEFAAGAARGLDMRPGDHSAPPIEWTVSDGLVRYDEALARMEARVAAIADGHSHEWVWLLEHPPLYTAGTGARDGDLLIRDRFQVYRAGRGGEFTYHGPGQRVAYVMLDLKRRTPDIRRYVAALEQWLIASLAHFNVIGERREGRVGVWVRRPDKPARGELAAEDKIAAIGIRVRRWVSFHGISINVDPDLEHYSGIVPCGISSHGVTSLVDLGFPVSMAEVDGVLRSEFETIFGSTTRP
jgi:lipoyl(octanoyl) transferase